MSDMTSQGQQPLVPAEKSLPEITLKVVILSIILTVVLAGANAYLGLKVGITVSSSIPAAVISMAVLRIFRTHNVLENNMVQTAASVGEALTAGMAFILPALLVLHYWHRFDYWQTMWIGLLGGFLGVFLTVPLRRAMINDKSLRFPEGTAIGHVLLASAKAKTDIRPLAFGGIVSAVIALFQSGFGVLSDSWQFWFARSSGVYGFGLGFSPALIAAGYIIGPTVAVSLGLGMVISWVVILHIVSLHFAHAAGAGATDIAMNIWSSHLRYVGVGTMLVGGLWTLATLLKPVFVGLAVSLRSLKTLREGGDALPRTEKDIPINYVGWSLLGLLFCVFILIFNLVPAQALGFSSGLHWFISIINIVYVLVMGFLFAAISAYFAGLIGSTNNPLSGLLIALLLILSVLLVRVLSATHFIASHEHSLAVSALAVMVCAVLSGALILANDTMQDLKAGQMVGSTPWKQQVMLLLGVAVAAVIIPLILELLFNAYGMAGVFPRAGMDASQMLAAPQAGMMAAVTQGVFTHSLPWGMLGIGAIVAVSCIVVDELCKLRGSRLPVLAVGLGIYLPLAASTPMLIGGLLRYVVETLFKRRYKVDMHHKKAHACFEHGLILACGLVAGAAIMGVVLAIPFAISKNSDVLRLVSPHFQPIAHWLSVAVTLAMCYWVYRTVMGAYKNQSD